MIIDKITVTTDWVGDAIRTKVYKTLIDHQGKSRVDYTQYLYVPYSERGQEVKEQPKGSNVDVRA